MWAEIPNLIQSVEQDTSIKVLLIHGGSAGAFAAGADISEFDTIYASRSGVITAGQVMADALNAVENCSKPVVAAIEGACVGGGVSLAMAADIRIASDTAKFGVTPAKLGLVYPPGDTRRLLTAIGPSRTKDVLFTGRIFPATEALDMKLVDKLVPADELLDAARDYANSICKVSQWSTRAIKRMIKGLQDGWTDADEQAVNLFADGFENDDHLEGYKAFLEKRKPNFTL